MALLFYASYFYYRCLPNLFQQCYIRGITYYLESWIDRKDGPFIILGYIGAVIYISFIYLVIFSATHSESNTATLSTKDIPHPQFHIPSTLQGHSLQQRLQCICQ